MRESLKRPWSPSKFKGEQPLRRPCEARNPTRRGEGSWRPNRPRVARDLPELGGRVSGIKGPARARASVGGAQPAGVWRWGPVRASVRTPTLGRPPRPAPAGGRRRNRESGAALLPAGRPPPPPRGPSGRKRAPPRLAGITPRQTPPPPRRAEGARSRAWWRRGRDSVGAAARRGVGVRPPVFGGREAHSAPREGRG